MRIEAGVDPIARDMVVYHGKNFAERKDVIWIDDTTKEYAVHPPLINGRVVRTTPDVHKASRVRISLHAKCAFILD